MATQEVKSVEAECEVCGREPCECPRPLGECCICKTPIFDEKDALTDPEGDHWCRACGPESWPSVSWDFRGDS